MAHVQLYSDAHFDTSFPQSIRNQSGRFNPEGGKKEHERFLSGGFSMD